MSATPHSPPAATTPPPAPRWVVLKFGGTSVASAERWATIGDCVEQRLAAGLRPLIVCSAVAGVSNRLEELLSQAVAGQPHEAALATIRDRHLALGAALAVDAAALLAADFEELSRLALGASLLRQAGPAIKARVLAFGELLSTRLGAAHLAARGLPVTWLDARTALEAHDPAGGYLAAHEVSRAFPATRDGPGGAHAARAYLSAVCDAEPDPELAARLAATAPTSPTAPVSPISPISPISTVAAVLTQGFIARNRAGETVLLGRGGSDTSAACFAAKLGAERCEIWTDVPGLFTANPALIPSARLLRVLDYDEAQEIATTGAKVLHPRTIPPLRRQSIPLHVLSTLRPEAPGTVVTAAGLPGGPQVKAISARRAMTLISMDTLGMWQEVGFLADVFACFARHGLSIDSVSTSETNVTVSLDPGANLVEPAALDGLLRELSHWCEPRLIAPAASLSLVGRGIRTILHELGPVLEAFEELKIHMLTQSASDLNLTVYVDEAAAERLVGQLHDLLFGRTAESELLGPTWSDLQEAETEGGEPRGHHGDPAPWWRRRQADLLAVAAGHAPVFAYDAETLEDAARRLLALAPVDRLLFAVKANNHPDVLRLFHRLGLGFDCVSAAELEHIAGLFPDLAAVEPARLLFTPNFTGRAEMARGFELGARVTVDNLHPLQAWPDLFAGRDIFLRLDPGQGRGHHAHVRTAGAQSKFGLSAAQLDEIEPLLARCGARVVGLHAHVGSGIRAASAWTETALFLAGAARRFPAARILDVGGGLGVPERPGQAPLDLAAVAAGLGRCKAANPGFELWLEPGRYLVAQAGVLLARVTQIKHKGEVTYVGVDTGMNSLIRPALYNAHHPIVNLSRLDQPATQLAHVVGPICETGDILGHSRRLAPAAEGDVLLIANAGAYGRVMSSHYNMRPPAGEILLPHPHREDPAR